MTIRSLRLAKDLTLPLDVVTEKLCWLGRTGSGKTYGAMKLAELMLEAGAQIGALDPVGVWRALRVPAEKGGASFEVVVFGGLYGDLPLEPHAGELIADLVCDRGLSFVLDVSQFIPSEQQRFVQAFGARFFQRKKSAPSAVHLFMEECQEFIPENPSGQEAQTLGVMQRLWKLGRNFGIGGSLISQRPQEVAKKALNMSGTMFAFQMTGPQERKAVKAWVADHGIATDIESVLQKLRTGEPHVESPTFLNVSTTIRILPRVTADLSSTPKVGASTAAKRPLTPIDVEQLKSSMAATIEKQKADDPRELRKRIVELERRLKTADANSGKDKPSVETGQKTKNVPVLTDADRALLEKVADKLIAMRGTLMERLDGRFAAVQAELAGILNRCAADAVKIWGVEWDHFEQALDSKGFQKILGKLATVTPAAISQKSDIRRMTPAEFGAAFESVGQIERRPATSRSVRHVSEGLSSAEQRVLDAVAWWHAARISEPSRLQVAMVARYTVNGHFNNLVGGLRTKGLVDYPSSGGIMLTPDGQKAANPPDGELTRDELITRVMGVLRTEPLQRIFAEVVKEGGVLSREDLAARSRYTVNGHFNNMVGSLRSLGVIDYPSKGGVQLADMFEALS